MQNRIGSDSHIGHVEVVEVDETPEFLAFHNRLIQLDPNNIIKSSESETLMLDSTRRFFTLFNGERVGTISLFQSDIKRDVHCITAYKDHDNPFPIRVSIEMYRLFVGLVGAEVINLYGWVALNNRILNRTMRALGFEQTTSFIERGHQFNMYYSNLSIGGEHNG